MQLSTGVSGATSYQRGPMPSPTALLLGAVANRVMGKNGGNAPVLARNAMRALRKLR